MSLFKFLKSKLLIVSLVLAFLVLGLVCFVSQSLAEDSAEERQALEQELRELEERITQYDQDISKTEAEKKTLQNQIYILRNKIKKLDLQIYQGNVMIKDLGIQIEDTKTSIEKTALKIEDSREKLINILRLIYIESQRSPLEILVSEERLSNFFDNLLALETLDSRNQELLDYIKELKVDLENQERSLGEERVECENVVKIQNLQKEEQQGTKKETEQILKLTEAEYQKSLQEKREVEEEAAEIRARIFELIGVPEAPTFGEAYEIAKYVETMTGVRPAFLLAILTQESNIGKNVGQCYLKNPSTGAGVVAHSGKSISRVMGPKKSVPRFLEICRELGRDPYNTLVSCPMSYGWGGAMGPAQFIPSTWVLYKNRVKAITGKPADPWNIKDAFLAAGLYLGDCGAKKQTYNSEWRAAMIYFSGSVNTKYRFYGDSVMRIVSRYEKDIKVFAGL